MKSHLSSLSDTEKRIVSLQKELTYLHSLKLRLAAERAQKAREHPDGWMLMIEANDHIDNSCLIEVYPTKLELKKRVVAYLGMWNDKKYSLRRIAKKTPELVCVDSRCYSLRSSECSGRGADANPVTPHLDLVDGSSLLSLDTLGVDNQESDKQGTDTHLSVLSLFPHDTTESELSSRDNSLFVSPYCVAEFQASDVGSGSAIRGH